MWLWWRKEMNPLKQQDNLLLKVGNVIVAFFAMVIWSAFVVWITSLLAGEKTYSDSEREGSVAFNLVMTCILPPLWEELKYRVVYLKVAKFIDRATNANGEIIILGMLVSSIDFGWGHGFGIYSLLMQGVFGLMLAWVYIKNGYSYISSVALHFLWNTYVIFG